MNRRLFQGAGIALASFFVAGCSWFEGDKSSVIFDEAQGVDARQLVDGLPNNLTGDEKNKRYLMSPMVAESIAAEDEDGA